MQFFRPLPVGTLQSLLKHVDHGLVRGFRLSARLGMSGCDEGNLYAPVLVELLEVVARELGPFSVTISRGTPKRVITFVHRNLRIWRSVIRLSASALTHMEK